MDKDTVKMTINIAGESITINVGFSEQEHVREVEKDLQNLYNDWRERFSRYGDKKVLAMVAYQFASYYRTLAERERTAVRSLEGLAKEVDDIL